MLDVVIRYVMQYPVPAVCKGAVDSLCQTFTYLDGIVGGKVLRLPAGLHLFRRCTIGEVER